MKFSNSLRDTIYGTVPVTSCEQEILKLPIMTRLKNVKQLGLAYLSFPGGNHTRFEHSLGTMHVAYLMSQGVGLKDEEIETIRSAALLHDVGHAPFSHCIEFAFRMFNLKPTHTHEDATHYKIMHDPDLAGILKNHRPFLHIEDVAQLASGKHPIEHFKSIVSGPIDADKIDYILRDNYHCGFPVGLDINTITEILSKDPSGKKSILIKPEGRSFAEQLFIARYHLITKIHHDKTNRLATYLMALTLKDALERDNTNAAVVVQNLFYEWTESELLTYLKEKSPDKYGLLRDFMLGKETVREVANYGFRELSPYGRYNAAILSANPSHLPELSSEISNQVGKKRLMIDAFFAKPPDLSLASAEPSINLMDTPLVRGAVQASLSSVHLAVYSFDELEERDFDFDKIIDFYNKNLDETLDRTKAESLIKNWFDGKKADFCLLHLVEYLSNLSAIEVRKHGIPPSDILIIILQAVYEAFLERFEKRVYVDSLSNLVLSVYLKAIEANIFKKKNGDPLDCYEIRVRNEGGRQLIDFDPNLFIDLELLDAFGLVYRLSRIIKFGAQYTQKYQLRVSGWGRGYYNRSIASIDEESALFERLREFIDAQLKTQETNYKRYFELVTKEQLDPKMEREAEDIRKKTLTLKVVI